MTRKGPKDTAICKVSVLLVLVLPAGYCGCHSPMAAAMSHLAGHRVGTVLPMLVGRDKGEMLGLEVGMEPVSCCVWPCRAVKPVVNSSCSNVAVCMTKLVLPPTDGFWGRFVVVLREERCPPHWHSLLV